MQLSRPRRRMALAAGLAAGLALASLPVADADLLDPATTTAAEDSFAPQLVTVTADLAQRNVIADSGLDVTEHAGHDYVEVVLHTPADLELLESLGLPFDVRIPDLVARNAEIQAANRAYAASLDGSPLPSKREDYRSLEDYNADMVQLATDHPELVRLFKLPHPSVEGKDILGVEIASGLPADTTPDEIDVIAPATDERPTFVLMGLHHAREWPSGEHTLEFAFDLAKGHAAKDPVITDLVGRVRTVIVPVINPDGFEKSYFDGKTLGVDLREINYTDADVLGGSSTSILATPGNAYKRKNCRPFDGSEGIAGVCDAAKSQGGFGIGVDLNRNYGAFHGGPGAAAEPPDPTYHGPEGFSEPETQNVREVVSQRHVTMLISNHTFSNLVLRPNGVNPQTEGPDGNPIGDAPDEDAMKELGARMTAQNGYQNIHGWQLYDTTGTTEDWSYNATGGFGYTFEIGAEEFHPPFSDVVDEYLGAGEFEGKGNRAAYLIALESAADAATHSIISGKAPRGATLTLSRTASTPTWEGSFEDTVETTLQVPASREFAWHVNPSTRPLAMSKRFSVLPETPSETFGTDGMVPAPGEHVDIDWEVTEAATLANVALDWQLPDDLDLEVYRVDGTDEDGNPKLTQVGSSGAFVGEKELATFADVTPGDYIIRVINFAAAPGQPYTVKAETFQATQESTVGLIETWTLSCFQGDELVDQIPVIVDRGRSVKVGKVCQPDRKR